MGPGVERLQHATKATIRHSMRESIPVKFAGRILARSSGGVKAILSGNRSSLTAFDTLHLPRYPSIPIFRNPHSSYGAWQVIPAPRVLIIDPSAESREVLRLLLERCGMRTLEAERPQDAIRLTEEFRPDLIVLDAESHPALTDSTPGDLRQASGRTDLPIVILGKFRPVCEPAAGDQFVGKPYHYGPLVRKIDGLLDAA
jgi:hypothetical protein